MIFSPANRQGFMQFKTFLQRSALKILCLTVSVWLMFFAAACPSKDNSSSSKTGGIFSSDETAEAAETVKDANNILKKIKQRFKDNEPRLEELQNALKEKNADKVKSISDQFITEINAGTEEGTDAITKLRAAKDKNINADYSEYLELKILALEKYIQAYEERRQVAIFLRQNYDPKSEEQRKIFKDEYDRHEEKFKEIMEEARKLSEQANLLAKESLNRKS